MVSALFKHISISNKTKDWALVQNAALANKKNAFKVLKNKSNYRFNFNLSHGL